MAASKILLVEDDLDLAVVLGHVLNGVGYEVVGAADGADALAKAEVETFSVVLTDVQMPKMSGVELAIALKEMPTNMNTPVVIMTGVPRIGDVKRLAEFGFAHMLVKPFDPSTLVATLADVLAGNDPINTIDASFLAMAASAVETVLRLNLQTAPVFGLATAHRGQLVSQGVSTAIVPLAGAKDLGFVACSLTNGLIRAISTALFGQAGMNLSESLAADLTGELANQVAGEVRRRLAVMGRDVGIGIPQVVFGVGHKILMKTGNSVHRLHYSCGENAGILDFQLAKRPAA